MFPQTSRFFKQNPRITGGMIGLNITGVFATYLIARVLPIFAWEPFQKRFGDSSVAKVIAVASYCVSSWLLRASVLVFGCCLGVLGGAPLLARLNSQNSVEQQDRGVNRNRYDWFKLIFIMLSSGSIGLFGRAILESQARNNGEQNRVSLDRSFLQGLGWRQGLNSVAALVVAIGVSCLVVIGVPDDWREMPEFSFVGVAMEFVRFSVFSMLPYLEVSFGLIGALVMGAAVDSCLGDEEISASANSPNTQVLPAVHFEPQVQLPQVQQSEDDGPGALESVVAFNL